MNDLTEHIILAKPVIGCSKDCSYCYAKKLAKDKELTWDFSTPFLAENWEEEITAYPNSVYMLTGMSDIAEWEMPWLSSILDEVEKHPENQYLALTKRPEDIKFSCPSLGNFWLGVSVTNKEDLHRISELRSLNFKNKFIAFEPLQEDLGDLGDTTSFSWCSIGQEIGDREDKVLCEKQWVLNILSQWCTDVLMKDNIRDLMGDYFQQSLPEGLSSLLKEDTVSTLYQEVKSTNK